jgi:hypothetical protein
LHTRGFQRSVVAEHHLSKFSNAGKANAAMRAG